MQDKPRFDRVLLTGATGFLGSAVARALLEAGHGVRVLVRDGTPRGAIDGLDVEIAPGDLLDHDSVRRAARGADAVLHCAADYRIWVPDPDRMTAINVTATEVLMRAALENGARRIVHVSSVATLKPRKDGRAVDETAAAKPEEAIGPYKRSKTEGERVVEKLVAEAALPAVIVNPSTPVGPRDRRPTPTGRLILEAAAGQMPAYVDTGLNIVHSEDCAAGCVAALERGRIGERYILGGDDVPMGDLVRGIAAMTGRRNPVRLPRGPLFPVAVASELWARVSGAEPRLTRDALKMAGYQMFFSSEKAKRELGYAARPYAEAVRDAINWFRQHNYFRDASRDPPGDAPRDVRA